MMAAEGTCTCYVTYGCYDYYGYYYDPYCNYSYMDPYYSTGDYYPAYYDSLAAQESVPHPDPGIEAKASDPSVDLVSYMYIRKDEERDTNPPGDPPKSTATLDDSYPCDRNEAGLRVLCDGDGAEAREEDYLVVGIHVAQEVPLEAEDTLVLSYAFQRDTDPDNDYVPPDELANDYVGGTDRWYVATRSPGDGWSFEAFESTGTDFAAVDTDARLILEVETAVLMVPAAEFEVPDPASRVSLFRHDGDEGRDSGDWSGFVYPPLDQPLVHP